MVTLVKGVRLLPDAWNVPAVPNASSVIMVTFYRMIHAIHVTKRFQTVYHVLHPLFVQLVWGTLFSQPVHVPNSKVNLSQITLTLS
jgi:hypothetical protein